MAKRFSLAEVASDIECPLLVVHGENDRIVPLESARRLFAAAGSKHKTLKIFTAAEGGAEHCQVDNRQLGVDYIADWLTPIFGRTNSDRMPSNRRVSAISSMPPASGWVKKTE
jgi:dipeptidyl aminopeptidase/acylaminoacyl peptidase